MRSISLPVCVYDFNSALVEAMSKAEAKPWPVTSPTTIPVDPSGMGKKSK
jgi:hypothetical protein